MANMTVRAKFLNNHRVEATRVGDRIYIQVFHGEETRAVLQMRDTEAYQFGNLLTALAK